MTEQRTNAALREQIAQWTRAALGSLVEYDPLNEPAPHLEGTTCCIVGGGPAGAVLALLLAREGIPVLLLEAHTDFDRDFRGDTLQARALEIIDELGLTDRLLQHRHTKLSAHAFQTPVGPRTPTGLTCLHTPYSCMSQLAQVDVLDIVITEAKRFPTFRLVMGAHVEKLIEEDGVIRGVCYRDLDGWHEVRAQLTVGADGRYSWVRRLLGWKPIPVGPPTGVFWFRLPQQSGDPETLSSRLCPGSILMAWKRSAYWQFAYLVPPESDRQWRVPELQVLRQAVARLLPEFADRVESLQEWEDVWFLSVEPSRLARWYCPGLLLVGDAAHVMAPVGDVGITCAMQDAVVAANVLSGPLKAGRLHSRDLAKVQRRREWTIRFIQEVQALIQLRSGCALNEPFIRLSCARILSHLPFRGNIFSRLFTLGIWHVHVKNEQRSR